MEGENSAARYSSLILLTVQQASMPLMVRYTRFRHDEKDVFITTVNVFVMELLKLTFCSLIIIAIEKSPIKFLAQCRAAIWDDRMETLKICVPALIYTVQNNLYYVSLSHLDATTFCVVYQLKIFTTAILLVSMLGRTLSRIQWFALLMLAVGVADVQLQYQTPVSRGGAVQNPLIGFAAVITMCFTSAFAGVYLEKVLKKSQVSVWMQNIRLALLGIPISAVSLFLDRNLIAKDGLWRGWDTLVVVMTVTNSIGGLLIAVVMKYADNILKAYAQSMAIVGAAVGSIILFDFIPNLMFSIGTMLVCLSIYLYSKYPAKVQTIVDKQCATPRYNEAQQPLIK